MNRAPALFSLFPSLRDRPPETGIIKRQKDVATGLGGLNSVQARLCVPDPQTLCVGPKRKHL